MIPTWRDLFSNPFKGFRDWPWTVNGLAIAGVCVAIWVFLHLAP
jgi:hypothetical protein